MDGSNERTSSSSFFLFLFLSFLLLLLLVVVASPPLLLLLVPAMAWPWPCLPASWYPVCDEGVGLINNNRVLLW
jgi:hypothetical protein